VGSHAGRHRNAVCHAGVGRSPFGLTMLALKLFLVPSLLALVSLVARVRGPAAAGVLAGFPIVAAPVLLLVSLENGALFAAAAAAGAVNAALANAAFCLGYAVAATRYRWWLSLPLGLLTYSATGAALVWLDLSPYALLPLTLAGLWLAADRFPAGSALPVAAPHTPRDVVVRMFAGVALVMTVTLAAPDFGPRTSGLLSGFPILACVLAGSSHHQQGARFAITLLRGMISGFFGMVFCFATLALTLPRLGIPASFALACIVAGLLQLGLLRLQAAIAGPSRAPHIPDRD
jgi:hypothetical protein